MSEIEDDDSRGVSHSQADDQFRQVVAQGPTGIPNNNEISAALASVLPSEAAALAEIAGRGLHSTNQRLSLGSRAEEINIVEGESENGHGRRSGPDDSGGGNGSEGGGSSWAGMLLWPVWGTIDALKWAGQTVNERAVAPVVRYARPMGWVDAFISTVKGLTPQRARDLARVVGNATFNAAGLTQSKAGMDLLLASRRVMGSFACAGSSPAARQAVLESGALFVKVAKVLAKPEAKDALQQGTLFLASILDVFASRHTKIFLQDAANVLCRAAELAHSPEATVMVAELTANIVHALEMEHLADTGGTGEAGAGGGAGGVGAEDGKNLRGEAAPLNQPPLGRGLTKGMEGGSNAGPWEDGGWKTGVFVGDSHLDGGIDYQEAIEHKFTHPSTPLPTGASHLNGEDAPGHPGHRASAGTGAGAEAGVRVGSNSGEEGNQGRSDPPSPGGEGVSRREGLIGVPTDEPPLNSRETQENTSGWDGSSHGSSVPSHQRIPSRTMPAGGPTHTPTTSEMESEHGEGSPQAPARRESPRQQEERGGRPAPGMRLKHGRALLPRYDTKHFEEAFVSSQPRTLEQHLDPPHEETIGDILRSSYGIRRRQLLTRSGDDTLAQGFAAMSERQPPPGCKGILFFVIYSLSALYGLTRALGGVVAWVRVRANPNPSLPGGITGGSNFATSPATCGSLAAVSSAPLPLQLPSACRHPSSGAIMQILISPEGACIAETDPAENGAHGASIIEVGGGGGDAAACASSFRMCRPFDLPGDWLSDQGGIVGAGDSLARDEL